MAGAYVMLRCLLSISMGYFGVHCPWCRWYCLRAGDDREKNDLSGFSSYLSFLDGSGIVFFGGFRRRIGPVLSGLEAI